MRVLVIGGTGFIGSYVVRTLVTQGHKVAIFHRGNTEADLPASVQHIHGDRVELSTHTGAFDRCAPDVVLHMVPMNERDAEAAVRTFEGRASRIVAISSADVYRARNRLFGVEPGPPDPIPLDEDAPLRSALYPYRATVPGPEHPLYDYDKILVERIVMDSPVISGTVLRLPFVYGPGDRQHRLFEYLRRMDHGRSSIPLGEAYAAWRSTRGYVENVGAAIALVVTHEGAAGRIYNVGEEPAFTEGEWVRKIGEAAGWTGEVAVVPEGPLPGPVPVSLNWTQDLVFDTTRIRHELGYREVVPLKEGLRRTVDWERSHPPEPTPPPPDYRAEDAAVAQRS